MVIGGWRGPRYRVFDAGLVNGAEIRAWIRSAVGGHGCPADAGDAAMVVSELWTNAVQHGPAGGRVLVGYCLWNGGARIVVCDGGGVTKPQLNRRTGLAEGGRGLQVVDELAARWGSLELGGAQVVWCDLGQPLRAPAADTWAWLLPVLAACDLAAAAEPLAGVATGTLAGAGAR